MHDLNLDEVQINELLYKLNQVFREKEEKNIAKITTKFQNHFFWNHKKKLDEQISNLKEKLSIKAMNNNKLSSYNKVDIAKEGFKTSYGSTTDSVDKMKGEIDNIKLNFDRLEKEYRNRVKDIDISIKNENGKDNGIKLLKSSVEWLIFSMKDVIKNSMNDLTQIKK